MYLLDRMPFVNYLFYCHYILYERLRKEDFPEVKATAMLALSACCLLFTVLFATGNFFRVITSIGLGVFVQVLLVLAYYLFIHKDRYQAIISARKRTRSSKHHMDMLIAVLWRAGSCFSIVIYAWLKYD